MALARPHHLPNDGKVTDTLNEVPDGTSSVRHHAMWVILIGLAVAVLVIIGVIVFTSDSSGVTVEQQLASVRHACLQWSGNSAPKLGTNSASATCSTMVDWMNQQLRNGQMTGPMMWSTATAMGATCRQWMSTSSRITISATASSAWCDEMVGWMEQHIGNWDGWMMNGNMMRGDAAGNGAGT
jgi:hypothetical protein